jgi:hypothetical protein
MVVRSQGAEGVKMGNLERSDSDVTLEVVGCGRSRAYVHAVESCAGDPLCTSRVTRRSGGGKDRAKMAMPSWDPAIYGHTVANMYFRAGQFCNSWST